MGYCILGGKVFVNDPANLMNGWATLTGIEWYTQMPIDGDYQTGRIVNPSRKYSTMLMFTTTRLES